MKILVLGLDCAAPELLLGYEDLPNIRRLMEVGCYGRLESVIPPITVPAWMCLATSQDPGSLGVYGFRNRTDHSYSGLGIASSRSITEPAIWDHLAREGKRSIIVGVPPGYPPRKINGLSVSCFLTPDTDKNVFTHPPELSDEIRKLVGHYPVDAARLPHRRQGLAPRRDLRHEPDAVPGRPAPDPDQGVGLLPLRRHRAGPHPPRVLEVPRPAARPARARLPVQGDGPRLLPPPRRRDRQGAGAARPTTRSCWWSRTTGRSGSTAASASTSGWCARACSS